jgi:hypothetical protein
MSRTALHGDVFGYSRLIADNEIETINTLRVFASIIETVVAAHSGDMGGKTSFRGQPNRLEELVTSSRKWLWRHRAAQ